MTIKNTFNKNMNVIILGKGPSCIEIDQKGDQYISKCGKHTFDKSTHLIFTLNDCFSMTSHVDFAFFNDYERFVLVPNDKKIKNICIPTYIHIGYIDKLKYKRDRVPESHPLISKKIAELSNINIEKYQIHTSKKLVDNLPKFTKNVSSVLHPAMLYGCEVLGLKNFIFFGISTTSTYHPKFGKYPGQSGHNRASFLIAQKIAKEKGLSIKVF